jgi:2-polyprenyl-3-methyl-5-hydroxy-6-metoxy-1,4-benzoquinol methylase
MGRAQRNRKGPELTTQARIRLAALVDRAEADHVTRREAYKDQLAWRWRVPEELHAAAIRLVLENFGIDLSSHQGPRQLCERADIPSLLNYLRGCAAHLRDWEERPYFRLTNTEFQEQVSGIFEDDAFPYRMTGGGVRPLADSDAEALRRTLLANPADMAACEQGDVQVEIVVSTIQERLSRPQSVLVDYGCGLGRVLQGLASAPRFKTSSYIAVDEPIPESVRQLAGEVGASARFLEREKYLKAPVDADVILAVNVLHHIPFSELPSQLSTLLKSLKQDGILVVHEINELRHPEQRNVPWLFEDIFSLLSFPGLHLNPRTTQSKRTRTPLSNVVISVNTDIADIQSRLQISADSVWHQMKQRTLASIAEMYDTQDEDRHLELQHALITNANLDLNRPSKRND